MKRFKNILYILDEMSLSRPGSAVKVAELARLNEARVTVMIAEETKFFDDLSRRMTGRYKELQQAVIAHHQERLDEFLHHERWQDISVKRQRYGTHRDYDRSDGYRTNTDFKRILAAVDVGSNYPETAALNKKILELTHSLAQREGGEAHYLHSWRLEYEQMLHSPRFKVSTEDISEMKKDLLMERQSEMSRLLENNHIHHEDRQVHIREGSSSEVIQQAIKELEIDVVVMGSVGRTGIPGLLIGNKAEKLLSDINCTVLTVKPDGFRSPVTLD